MNKVIEPTEEQLLFSSLCPTLILCSTSPNRKKLLECAELNRKLDMIMQDIKDTTDLYLADD